MYHGKTGVTRGNSTSWRISPCARQEATGLDLSGARYRFRMPSDIIAQCRWETRFDDARDHE